MTTGLQPGAKTYLCMGMRGEPVRAVQRRLESLGFEVGTTDGIFGAKTLNAVREFQRAHRLVVDGVVGIETWKKLGFEGRPVIPRPGSNKTSSGRTSGSSGRTSGSSGRTGGSPAPTPEKKAKLTFNGSSLCWVWLDGSTAPVCWTAVSGRSGYQTKKNQNLKDKGPLPEGEWLVAQGKYQLMPNRNVFEQAINELGRGGWPGGESSWGRHRIWLQPKNGTQTYGRSGFSIHGGESPGSAGCIDLTDQLTSFIVMFLSYGKDMDLTVKYE